MKIVLMITVALWCALHCSAQEAASTNTWIPRGTLSMSLQERYIGIRSSRVMYDGLSFWSELSIDLPKGFYSSIWNHYGVAERTSSKQTHELDLTVGWREKLPWWDVEMGVASTILNNTPLDVWLQRDVWSQAITLSKSYVVGNHVIKPQLRVEWLSRATDIGDGAILLMPNVSHTWRQPFGIKPLNIAEQLFINHDDGFDPAKNDSEGYFLRWNIGARWKIKEVFTLTLPSFSIQAPIHVGKDGRGQATSWGMSLSVSF